MARIPTFQVGTQQLGVSRAPTVSPAQAAATSRAVSQAGMTVAQIGGQELRRQSAEEKAAQVAMEREQETKAAADYAQYQSDMILRQQELQQERADSPDGFTGDFLKESEDALNKLISENGGAAYEAVMRDRYNRSLPSMTRNSISYESKQKTANQVSRLSDSTDALALGVLRDPSFLPEAVTQIKGNYALAREAALIPNADELQETAISQLYGATVESYIQSGNLQAAEQFLDDEDVQERLGYGATVKAKLRLEKEKAALEKANKKLVERKAKNDAARFTLATGLPVDPYNKNVKDIFNVYYEDSQINDGLIGGNVESAQELAGLVAQTNFVPSLARSTLTGQLFNGTYEQRAYAADTISRLEETSVVAMAGFPSDVEEQATLASKYLRAGMKPEDAFKAVDQQTDPKQKDLVSFRKGELNKQNVDYIDYAREAMELPLYQNVFGFQGDPDIPEEPMLKSQIQQDYKALYDSAYIRTGDEDVATTVANRQFRRNYGVYKGNIMKYAPSNYYLPGENDDWIQEEVAGHVTELGGNADTAFIVADYVTARQATQAQQPSYQLFVLNKDGVPEELVDKDGNRLRYQPNPEGKMKEHEAELKRRLNLSESIQKARDLESEEERALGGFLDLRMGK